jgi:phosphatidylglycerol:prolipoprotein diacylglycerol transferase
VLLAFVAGFSLINLRARHVGIQPERLIPIYIGSAVGGILGARILYGIAVSGLDAFRNPASLLAGGGLAFYGGLFGGALATLAIARLQDLPAWKLLDIMAPTLFLGLAIGRMGCFFAGCCHGAPAPIGEDPIALVPQGVLHGQIWLSDVFPWLTLEFAGGPGAGMTRRELLGIPLYPSQLWEAFGCIVVAALGVWMWGRRRFDGQVAGIILLVQPPIRFFVESYRADERGYALSWVVDHVPSWLPPGFTAAGDELPDGTHAILVGLTTSQFLGLLIMLAGAIILVVRRGRGVTPEVPLAEEL